MPSSHLQIPGVAKKKFFEQMIESDQEKYADYGEDTVILGNPSEPVKRVHALKPVFILQDRGCASSCESSIDFFEYVDHVKRVGENTAGFVHFGNMGFTMLPISVIQVNIASTFNTYRDGRFIEMTGIKPDIAVPAGEDAYSFLVDYISGTR